ncbi:MAG: hypothetical protein HP490_14955 [Nitrospira sp.]|nr:hypothetical protein [Nitrospira sp.]
MIATDLPVLDYLVSSPLAVLQSPAILIPIMSATKYILWEEQGRWCGYLQGYPDNIAYGKSFEDLQFKLRDLQRDLADHEHEDDRSPHATAVTAPPRVFTTRQIKTRARFEKIFLLMFPNP